MDANERKAFEEMMEAFRKLEKIVEEKKVEMRKFFVSLTVDEMKTEMRELDTDSLETLCDTLNALEHENYEICQAALEVLNERRNN